MLNINGLSDKKRFLLLTFLIWTLVAFFEFARNQILVLQGVMNSPSWLINPLTMLVSAYTKFYVWFALGFLIYELYEKFKSVNPIGRVLLYIVTGLAATSVHFIVGNIIYNAYLYGFPEVWQQLEQSLQRFFLSSIPMSTLNYGVIILILVILDLNKRYQEERLRSVKLNAQLSKSQLENLKMQLQPHFIFNAMNTISVLVRKQKNDIAVDMISGMSDLLRANLEREESQFVTLSYEISMLKKYLAIEQLRFKERLSISFDIQPETLALFVPNLILQPILENVFKHGFSENLEHSKILISAQLTPTDLLLTVANSGPQLPHGWQLKESKGIGIQNTISRLQTLYGENGQFDIGNWEPDGVIVKIQIPKTAENE